MLFVLFQLGQQFCRVAVVVGHCVGVFEIEVVAARLKLLAAAMGIRRFEVTSQAS